MSVRASLLGHLADRFKVWGGIEPLATSALLYVLDNSPAARTALLSLVDPLGVQLPRSLTYQEQVGAEAAGRPDIVGLSDGESVLVLELKFDAHFTARQPAGYLSRLPAGRPAVLMLVVPR